MSTRQRRQTANVITDTAEKVEEQIKNVLTVFWDDLPHWQQDNHYIRSGYRPESGSFRRSFASLFHLHNESVNIYSHLLGALTFTILGGFLFNGVQLRYHTATESDVLAFSCFFVGVSLCLGMSGTYHCISNHSLEVSKYGNKLDYLGIVFQITGSFIPNIYYGFYCHPHLQWIYWIMICSLGLICAAVSIIERFRTPAWRPYRAAMFTMMGLSGIFPVLHGLFIFGFQNMLDRAGLAWVLLQALCYILGAGIYAGRWPERTSPGSFDIWGSSHQIFHVLVLMAAASHLYGLLLSFDYRHGILGTAC